MKANEIMIGDFVRIPIDEVDGVTTSNGIAKIISIHSEGCIVKSDIGYTISIDYNLINAIPLTPEILEKNLFEILSEDVYRISNDLFLLTYDSDYSLCNSFDIGYGDEYNYITTIKYVHELQHILRLCKIDKEIIL